MSHDEESKLSRLASVGILGKEREPGVGKLGWQGKSRVRAFWTFLK